MSIIKRKAGSEDIVKSVLEFDEVPTEGSPNLVESGAVAKFTDSVPEGTSPENPLVNESALAEFELAMLTNIPCANNTLRFSFSKKDYDPTVAGIGTNGTWTKLATTHANVWDWTRSDANWSSIFDEAFRDGNDVAIIASGDLSSVTSMASLFRRCSDIVKICDLSTTSSVADFSRTFNGLSNLQKCPFVNTFSATNCQSMFNGCSKIESFSLFDTSNLKNSSYMFSACSALKSITLIDSSAITDATSMFSACFNVESGALALYTQMSSQTTPPAHHASCFSQCGKNTTTGAAELAQIPQSWGGTMPEP